MRGFLTFIRYKPNVLDVRGFLIYFELLPYTLSSNGDSVVAPVICQVERVQFSCSATVGFLLCVDS